MNIPYIPVDSIVIPERFVKPCADWAGGVDCKLRAVESTGNLTIGNRRPWNCDSDEQWYLTIWRDLSIDLAYTHRQGTIPYRREPDDLSELADFEVWVDEQIERLEESYGLADWDASDN